MEILNNIWSALTTENGTLIDILSTPLTILELCVFYALFSCCTFNKSYC